MTCSAMPMRSKTCGTTHISCCSCVWTGMWLWAVCMAHNRRAIRLYEREGCRSVSVYPNAVRFPDGSMADEYLMIKKW